MKIEFNSSYNPNLYIDTEEELEALKENKNNIKDTFSAVQKVLIVNSGLIFPTLFGINIIAERKDDKINDDIGGEKTTFIVQLPSKYIDIEDEDGNPITPEIVAKIFKYLMVLGGYLLFLSEDDLSLISLDDVKYIKEHFEKAFKVKYAAIMKEWTIDDYNSKYKELSEKLESWNKKIDESDPNVFGEV